jgi:hypothetical protein
MRDENARMQQFLRQHGIDARVKYTPVGSMKKTWRLFNANTKWTQELADKLNKLGFVDYNNKPLDEFSGNGGVFSVSVRGHNEFLEDNPMTASFVSELVKVAKELVGAAGPLTLLEELKHNTHKLDDDEFLKMTSHGWGHTPGVDYIFGSAGNDIAWALVGYEAGHSTKEKVQKIVKENIDQAIKDNQQFKGLRGEQKETRDLWFKLMDEQKKGRRNAGRDRLVTFLFEPKYVFQTSGFGDKFWAWHDRYGAGRPSAQNIKRYVEKFNEGLEPGGINQHLGRSEAIYGGRIYRQSTGETMAEWEDKGIIHSYKSKPAFEVSSGEKIAGELVKIAKELVSVIDSGGEKPLEQKFQFPGSQFSRGELDIGYPKEKSWKQKVHQVYDKFRHPLTHTIKDYDYYYDPNHLNKPSGGGWERTKSGWSKGKNAHRLTGQKIAQELVRVAKEIVAGYPSNYFKNSPARSRANSYGLMDVENEDLTAPGLIAKLEEWQHDEGGVEAYIYDQTAKALRAYGFRMPPGIERMASKK